MEGKILKSGHLLMSRPRVLQEQICPFTSPPATCGDWCPHFSEPGDWASGKRIEICHEKKLYFTELTDERI